MAKYLVTGGCGFIGSHLVNALQASGHEVVVLDNLSSGDARRLPKGVRLVTGDIRDAELVRECVADATGIFHLAAVASVEQCNLHWVDSHRTNLTGTITLFDAIRTQTVPTPVVWASSAAIYGVQATQPIAETNAPGPLTPYGVDKLGCELHASVAAGLFAIPNIGLRFFNVYGPGQDPRSPYSGVISIFLDRVLSGQSVVIHGDGSNTRDFVYVGDVVRVMMRSMMAMKSASPGTPAEASIFNVCTGRATRIDELLRYVCEATGKGTKPVLGAPRAGDIPTSVGSPEALQSKLHVTCDTSILAGLKLIVKASGTNQAPQT